MAIRTIRNFEELEAVRAYWENWQDYPNSDFVHFQLICRLRAEVICPHVTVVERNGEPCCLLIARLENFNFTPAIGYLKLARIPAKIITVLHRGVVGEVTNETALALVQHLLVLISSGEADAVVFHELPENSSLLQTLLLNGPRFVCEKKPAWSSHWTMTLPDQPGLLLKKFRAKHRTWVRKKQKEIEADFSGRLAWRYLSSFENVPELCTRLEAVAVRTYQRGLGAGFKDDREHRQRFALFADRGQLRVQLLEIQERIAAYWIGIIYRDTFHSWATAYDPDFGKYEVGTQILVRMVDELAQEGVRKLDFGLGDAHYKKRFGDHSWSEATLAMFAPTAKGVTIRSVLGASKVLDDYARRALQKTGVLDKLKTGWRRRLVMKAPENGNK
jgi:CelD/BcsL family acetyltransferase involved in cellulose biosynthesis